MNGLRCPFEGCHYVVHAMTGLQELTKLGQHYRRKHHVSLTLYQLADERVRIERSGVYVRKEAK